jgi:tetratricopeptide (TPR) repeat protein
MTETALDATSIEFGELPAPVDALLKHGVAAYRSDRARADKLFREALALAPQTLAAYYCLYKIHAYMGNLDTAASIAQEGMSEAARQAGWSPDPAYWPPSAAHAGAARFAVFTLKALSFIELKRGNRDVALAHLARLATLDPSGGVGWPVILALAQGTT